MLPGNSVWKEAAATSASAPHPASGHDPQHGHHHHHGAHVHAAAPAAFDLPPAAAAPRGGSDLQIPTGLPAGVPPNILDNPFLNTMNGTLQGEVDPRAWQRIKAPGPNAFVKNNGAQSGGSTFDVSIGAGHLTLDGGAPENAVADGKLLIPPPEPGKGKRGIKKPAPCLSLWSCCGS